MVTFIKHTTLDLTTSSVNISGSDQILIASDETFLLQTANVPIQMAEGTIVMARVL